MKIFILASLSSSLRNFRGPFLVALRARGHEVHVAAPKLKADRTTQLWLEKHGIISHDVPVSRAGLNPLEDLNTALALFKLMRRMRFEIFLGYTIKPVIWGLIAARLARVPYRVALITGLGYSFTGQPAGKRAIIQRVVRSLYAKALRRANLIFFQNHDDPVEMARQGMLPANVPVKVVNGSGVDLTHFNRVALAAGPTQFLLIARLLGDKGVREFARAAATLAPHWPGVGFHIVGGLDPNPDGIAIAEVEEWVRAGHIVWHGAIDDVQPVLATAHVYVLPSYREGTPRTVLEAMATGRAIITTDAPGCRETVRDGSNGFLVPVRNVEALVAAMEKFLLNPELIEQMGEKSREIVVDKYDVHKVNSAMINEMSL